jgi:transcription-repair coupling factor (superfamily II helicase)
LNLQQLLGIYSESDRFKTLAGKLSSPSPVKLRLTGLVGSVDAILASAVYRAQPRTQLFVFNDIDEARYFFSDLENLLEGKTILFFPSSYRRPFQITGIDNGLVLERAEVLNRLNQHSVNGELIVTTAEALSELVITEKDLSANTYELKVGHPFDLEFFIDFLTEHHFERSDFVYEAGQFSIRGGIVDVFSFSNDQPYRLELDGEMIESIRTFDPNTQLSVKRVDRFFIIPNVQKDIDNNERQNFFYYLPDDAVVWAKDINFSIEQIQKGREKAQEIFEKTEPLPNQDPLLPIEKIYETEQAVLAAFKKYKCIEFGTRFHFKSEESISFDISPQPVFKKNFKLLIQNLKENQTAEVTNLIFSESSRQVERLYTIFEDLDKDH